MPTSFTTDGVGLFYLGENTTKEIIMNNRLVCYHANPQTRLAVECLIVPEILRTKLVFGDNDQLKAYKGIIREAEEIIYMEDQGLELFSIDIDVEGTYNEKISARDLKHAIELAEDLDDEDCELTRHTTIRRMNSQGLWKPVWNNFS